MAHRRSPGEGRPFGQGKPTAGLSTETDVTTAVESPHPTSSPLLAGRAQSEQGKLRNLPPLSGQA